MTTTVLVRGTKLQAVLKPFSRWTVLKTTTVKI
jgi:hypothetical protein